MPPHKPQAKLQFLRTLVLYVDSFTGTEEEDKAFQLYLKNHVPMGSGSHSLIISRGMYELQLRPWFQAFPNEGTFLVLKLEDTKSQSGHNGTSATANKPLNSMVSQNPTNIH